MNDRRRTEYNFRGKGMPVNELPEPLLRQKQILGDSKAEPPIPPIIPVSPSTWWEGIKRGRYPKGIKLSPGVTVWRASDIRRLAQPDENGEVPQGRSF